MRRNFAGATLAFVAAGADAQQINVTNVINNASFWISAYAFDDPVRWATCAEVQIDPAPVGGAVMQSLNSNNAWHCAIYKDKLGLDLKITRTDGGGGETWCDDVPWGSTVHIRFDQFGSPQFKCQK